jgi:hypothetical protein
MIVRRGVAVVLALIGLSAVAGASILPGDELVLRPGDALVVRTPNGTLRVDALSAEKRRYRWPGVDRTLTLRGRLQPWLGAQGAYVPAGPSNDTNAEESSYDFASERTLQYYLQAFPPTAYGSDGTAVSFGTAPNGANAVQVEKLCVDHRPPGALRASAGSSFTWTHGGSRAPETASYGCARTIFDPVAFDEALLQQDYDATRRSNFQDIAGGECELMSDSPPSEAPAIAFGQTLALRAGATFMLRNANGSLRVEAPSTTTRVLRWRNARAGVAPFALDTAPREMTVELAGGAIETGVAGSVGCRRVSGATGYTITYDEGSLNLPTLGDFLAWMKWGDHGRLYLDDTYGSAGMMGGFRVGQIYGKGPILEIEVGRICIGGRLRQSFQARTTPRFS